jgi:lysophospholipid acyltransferase (LPLAT)-like uncharacterized protein
MLRSISRHSATQSLLAHALGWYLSFALRTSRWTIEGTENLAAHVRGSPAIMASWHERLPLMPMQWIEMRRLARRAGKVVRIHILISRSRDGRFIGTLVGRFGIDVLSGSTSRGGAVAMRRLVTLLKGGGLVGITPDGPRGPRRLAAQGVAQLAALSGAPILPCAAQTSRQWVLRSWDSMVIPKPFGRAAIVCGAPIYVDRLGWRGALPSIEAALTASADRADVLCERARRTDGPSVCLPF